MSSFFHGLTGEIVFPGTDGYDQKRQGYNRAIQQFPRIIVYCSDRYDVANAVRWAVVHGFAIRIRSGGHNYEGYSNGNSTLVIDISRMNEMTLDEESGCLYVEAGVTNSEVYRFVSSQGYPFPGGTCPTVGVSGLTLGGGWGLSCRKFGLACDSLTGVEMVDYKGHIIWADACENQDLFWALRGGGGGNFGVIVSLTFELPAKVRQVTLIEIDYHHVSAPEQEAFIALWQEWLNTADHRMTLLARVYNSPQDHLGILARGIFYGPPQEAEEILSPFLALPNAQATIERMPFLEAIERIGSVYPPFEKFNSVSGFVRCDFTEKEIQSIVRSIQKRAPGSIFAGFSMYALGGRVGEICSDATAFAYRDAKFICWLNTEWQNNLYASKNRAWIHERLPLIEKVTEGSYVNFPYSKLPCYLHQYYDDHLRRLIQIKRRYDPLNIFSFPQGLETTK